MVATTCSFVTKIYVFIIKFNFVTKTLKVVIINYDINLLAKFFTKASNNFGVKFPSKNFNDVA